MGYRLSGVVVLCLTLLSFSAHSANSQKAILISFDGGMNLLLQEHLKQNKFSNSGFKKMKAEGVLASNGLKVSLPSLTATSHISIITGLPPSQHGIVSNNFHRVSDPINVGENGFAAEWDRDVETLWQILMRQGKKVGVISYPGLDNTTPERSATWSINYANSEISAHPQVLKKTDFRDWSGSLPSKLHSESPPKVAELNPAGLLSTPNIDLLSFSGAKPSHTFYLFALDSTSDRRKNYDTLVIDQDRNLHNGYIKKITKRDPWFQMTYTESKQLKGCWSKLLSMDSQLNEVQLFIGSIYSTQAFPSSFQKKVDRQIGPWPGAPLKDYKELGLTREDFTTQANRLSEYLKDATLLGASTQQWDMIISYQPIIDELEHQFLTESALKNLSSADGQMVSKAYLQSDKVVSDIMTRLPDTNLIVVSDHGMSPIHHVFYPNRVIIDEDLASKALAYSSGGLSHVYVNVEGREQGGTVSGSESTQIIRQLKKRFESMPAVENVYTRQEATHVGLSHKNSGDLILVGKLGYHFNDSNAGDVFVEEASFAGQHGYAPNHPLMKGLFLAWGPDISHQSMTNQSYREIVPFALNLFR